MLPTSLVFSCDPEKFYAPPDHALLCGGSRTTSQRQQDDETAFSPFVRWAAAFDSYDQMH
jgi:hypothetical protein